MEEEATHNALFDKRLADEEIWIRQGIKAGRTRQRGARARWLRALRVERSQRLEQQGRAQVQVSNAKESGRKVIEAKDVSHSYDGQSLPSDFNLRVMRGDRIGLVGNNGVEQNHIAENTVRRTATRPRQRGPRHSINSGLL